MCSLLVLFSRYGCTGTELIWRSKCERSPISTCRGREPIHEYVPYLCSLDLIFLCVISCNCRYGADRRDIVRIFRPTCNLPDIRSCPRIKCHVVLPDNHSIFTYIL